MSKGGAKMPPETSEQKAIADVSMEEFVFGQQMNPVTAQFFKDMSSWSDEKAQITNMANADAQQTVAQAPLVGADRVNSLVDTALTRGKTVGGTNVNANIGSEQQRVKTQLGLADMAQGNRTEAMQGMQDTAADSLNRQIQKTRNVALADASRTNAITTGVGMAAGYGMPRPDEVALA